MDNLWLLPGLLVVFLATSCAATNNGPSAFHCRYDAGPDVCLDLSLGIGRRQDRSVSFSISTGTEQLPTWNPRTFPPQTETHDFLSNFNEVRRPVQEYSLFPLSDSEAARSTERGGRRTLPHEVVLLNSDGNDAQVLKQSSCSGTVPSNLTGASHIASVFGGVVPDNQESAISTGPLNAQISGDRSFPTSFETGAGAACKRDQTERESEHCELQTVLDRPARIQPDLCMRTKIRRRWAERRVRLLNLVTFQPGPIENFKQFCDYVGKIPDPMEYEAAVSMRLTRTLRRRGIKEIPPVVVDGKVIEFREMHKLRSASTGLEQLFQIANIHQLLSQLNLDPTLPIMHYWYNKVCCPILWCLIVCCHNDIGKFLAQFGNPFQYTDFGNHSCPTTGNDSDQCGWHLTNAKNQ